MVSGIHCFKNEIVLLHMRIDIVNIKPIKVAALEHLDNPETLEQSIEVFRTWRKESGSSPISTKRTFGVAHSRPEVKPAQRFRFDICAEVDVDIAESSYGVVNKDIEGGRYARLRHKGSHDDLQQKVNALYRTWLPNSDELQRDAPLFFEYVNLTPDALESELITYIYFPLKPPRE